MALELRYNPAAHEFRQRFKTILGRGAQPGRQRRTIDDDAVPNDHHSAPVRDAYLTVFDAKSGESLWTDPHN
jgi:hypothetical protein